MAELAKKHAEMISFVLDSMPPGYYDRLPESQKRFFDSIVRGCFLWYRSECFQQFIDQNGGIEVLAEKMQSEAEQFGTELGA